MLADKISHLVYHFIARLLFCRLAGNYEEQHTSTEDSLTARIGPLRLELNECFVLDHADAGISADVDFGMSLPFWRSVITLGLRVCVGSEQIREPGLYFNQTTT